jgi:hypothetical protein
MPGIGYIFSNWTARPPGGGLAVPLTSGKRLNFLMRSNLTLRANFVPNPFLARIGSYSGIFYASAGVQHERSGFFTLALRSGGGYSADLQLAGQRFGLSGKFTLDGRATNTVVRDGSNDVRVEWTLNLGHGPIHDLFGRVASADGAWEADLIGDRAPVYGPNASPYRGRYTFIIPGTRDAAIPNLPAGDGFGALRVETNGMLNLEGALADNTPITQSAQVSSNGVWPLYVSLYSGRGSLLGWVTLNTNPHPADSLTSVRLSWIKPPLGSGFYADGFELETTLIGSRYVKTPPILPLSNAVLAFMGGNLDAPVTNCVTLTTNSAVIGCDPQALTVVVARSNGIFSGTLTLTNIDHALSFRGAVLQRQTNGSGFFLGTNQSGRVYFGR